MILCAVINDSSFLTICRDRGFMISSLEEIVYDPRSDHLTIATNKNKGTAGIQLTIRNRDGRYLAPIFLIHSLLHELAHMTHSEHDHEFYEELHALQNAYLDNGTGMIKRMGRGRSLLGTVVEEDDVVFPSETNGRVAIRDEHFLDLSQWISYNYVPLDRRPNIQAPPRPQPPTVTQPPRPPSPKRQQAPPRAEPITTTQRLPSRPPAVSQAPSITVNGIESLRHGQRVTLQYDTFFCFILKMLPMGTPVEVVLRKSEDRITVATEQREMAEVDEACVSGNRTIRDCYFAKVANTSSMWMKAGEEAYVIKTVKPSTLFPAYKSPNSVLISAYPFTDSLDGLLIAKESFDTIVP